MGTTLSGKICTKEKVTLTKITEYTFKNTVSPKTKLTTAPTPDSLRRYTVISFLMRGVRCVTRPARWTIGVELKPGKKERL